MRIALFLAAFGLLLVASALSFGLRDQTRAAGPQIEVDSYYFCDPSFQGGVCEKTINSGDTVTWQVEGGLHTVTQCDDFFSTCPPAGGFNSGNLSGGQEFSQTFNSAGSFAFRCNNHPSLMRGRITVLAAATPTPSATATQAATTPSPGTPTATPGRAPASGGRPGAGHGASLWPVLLVATGGLLLLAGAGLALRASRRL